MRIVGLVAALALLATGAMAEDISGAKKARCLLVVDGTSYIDGPCWMRGENTLATTILSSKKFGGHRFFAILGEGEPSSWNGKFENAAGKLMAESHAHVPLGVLKKNGPCWVGERAIACAFNL